MKTGKYPKLSREIRDHGLEVGGPLQELIGTDRINSLDELFGGLGDDLQLTASYETMNEMHSHFAQIAKREKNRGGDKFAFHISSFVDKIDQVLKSDSEMFPELKLARTTYQKHYFDTHRDDGVAVILAVILVLSKNSVGFKSSC